jgi:hypothetical protein
MEILPPRLEAPDQLAALIIEAFNQAWADGDYQAAFRLLKTLERYTVVPDDPSRPTASAVAALVAAHRRLFEAIGG